MERERERGRERRAGGDEVVETGSVIANRPTKVEHELKPINLTRDMECDKLSY